LGKKIYISFWFHRQLERPGKPEQRSFIDSEGQHLSAESRFFGAATSSVTTTDRVTHSVAVNKVTLGST
jgi:hypothetical protein